MSSFVAYIMKSQAEAFRQDNRGDDIALACIRMLQDCPSHSSARRERLVVVLHLMNAPSRRAVVPHIEKLLNEKVILGQAVGSQDILRYAILCCKLVVHADISITMPFLDLSRTMS